MAHAQCVSVPSPIRHPLTQSTETEVAAHAEIKGVDFPPDSGAGLPGVFWYPTSTDPRTMTRSMSRMAHWDAASTRDNYDTLTGHKVLKVLFNGTTASGVTLVPSTATNTGQARTISAKKEIIIAAGTIHTPQVLQASGVGPKAVLGAAGINVIVDLPGVGSNFQDHPTGGIASFRCKTLVPETNCCLCADM